MLEIRFDDIRALEAQVSDSFEPWGPLLRVTQSLIDSFAELTGDQQWIHVDVERAERESPFGGTVAHGFLTLSLLPRLQSPPQWRVVGYRSAANYGIEGLRFLAPVPAGSAIHLRKRLAGVEARSSGTLLVWDYEVAAQNAEKAALVFQLKLLYRE